MSEIRTLLLVIWIHNSLLFCAQLFGSFILLKKEQHCRDTLIPMSKAVLYYFKDVGKGEAIRYLAFPLC